MKANEIPDTLAIIAGKGAYPIALAQSARAQGVKRIYAVAFKGETDRVLDRLVDAMDWIYVGQLGALLDRMQHRGARVAVMAGQITPTNLFRVRMDRPMLELLGRLKERNADTIFGAIGDELKKVGVELQPASRFMETSMPAAGLLSRRAPTAEEQADIALGLRVAKATSGLDIGQTVVIKQGTVLAVEAFEGTDAAIRRAGELGGEGAVVVKVAKRGHDMRFDIPVVGLHTMKTLRKAGIRVLAVEAGRTILLERDQVVKEAERLGLSFLAVPTDETTG
jgi:DUF1009 family protein